MSSVSLVRLKDGSEVPESDFKTISATLIKFAENHSVAFSHLVEKCKDLNYKIETIPFDDSEFVLMNFCLLKPNGQIDDIVKKIVLNSVTKEGLKYRFVTPLSQLHG